MPRQARITDFLTGASETEEPRIIPIQLSGRKTHVRHITADVVPQVEVVDGKAKIKDFKITIRGEP